MNCHLCGNKIEGDPTWTNCRMLCSECAAKPRHRYFYINRPFCIGCQPEGFIDAETWMPAKPQLLIGRGESPWHVLGWVEYPQPLTPEQVWKWELWPNDAAEVIAYLDWREEHRR